MVKKLQSKNNLLKNNLCYFMYNFISQKAAFPSTVICILLGFEMDVNCFEQSIKMSEKFAVVVQNLKWWLNAFRIKAMQMYTKLSSRSAFECFELGDSALREVRKQTKIM